MKRYLKLLLKYNKPIISIAILSTLIFLWISLLTYNLGDYADKHYPINKVKNLGGLPGAYIAQFFFRWMGLSSYVFFIGLTIYWMFFFLKKRSKNVFLAVLVICVVVLWFSIAASFLEKSPLVSAKMPSYGGLMGLTGISLLQAIFGQTAKSLFAVFSIGIAAWGALSWIEKYHFKGRSKNGQKGKREKSNR